MVTPLRGPRCRRPAGSLQEAPDEPERHQGRGGREDRLPPPELPLRPAQGRDVPEALSRRPGEPLGGLADPEAPGHEPPPRRPAVPAARGPVEALREAS